MIYDDDLEQARLDNEDLTSWLKRLKKKNPRKLDDVFQKHHDAVFEKVDCLECGNCCKTTSPIFRDVDVKRIAKKLRMPIVAFENNYLKRDGDGDLVLQEAPCSFLLDDNSCGIYDVRPQACREYPHTDRKKIVKILDLTKRNLDVCPAVCQIVNKVKEELG